MRASIFSTTTTAASTSNPIAIANPPSDMRFAVKPKYCIRAKVLNADRGKITATTKAARTFPRKRNNKISTRIIASPNAFVTVPIARSTKSPRL